MGVPLANVPPSAQGRETKSVQNSTRVKSSANDKLDKVTVFPQRIIPHLPIANPHPQNSLPMQPEVVQILSADEVRRTCNRLACEIVEQAGDLSQLVLLGIYTRGVPLAQLLAAQIEALEGVPVTLGALDITFYRDDLDSIGIRTPAKTDLNVDLTGRTVVLIDDVIFKGRTIRAALDAINDYGRPDRVRLAVLVDRGHRDLPIHPDFIGRQLPTAKHEQVKVYLREVDGRDSVEIIRPA